MEESIQTEPELSEEQLQAITGGCAQCTADLRKVTRLQGTAQTHLSQSEVRRAQNDNRLAAGHQNLATRNLRQAQIFLNRVAARGHQPPVPDLNLPAPLTNAGERVSVLVV